MNGIHKSKNIETKNWINIKFKFKLAYDVINLNDIFLVWHEYSGATLFGEMNILQRWQQFLVEDHHNVVEVMRALVKPSICEDIFVASMLYERILWLQHLGALVRYN
ncbi:hypothetical protein ACJX0J_022216 [Zea mays]